MVQPPTSKCLNEFRAIREDTKEYRFQGNEVVIKRLGNAVVLLPKDDPWQVMFDALAEFPEDFIISREQPEQQEREPIE